MTLIIDGSHISLFDFDTAVIDYAIDHGFIADADYPEIVDLVQKWTIYDDKTQDAQDAIYFILMDAMDYLNEIADEGKYYSIYESCLYLMADDESLTYNMI